ncbi:MAG TPA: hypothetical protein VFY04_02810 [Solirubrobacterales bacterium]|nr:hypothetical protein [Solirubrobacterales bacterium]
MADLLHFAHVSHYLWVLYVPPVLIVLGSVLWTMRTERRRRD